jgi:carbon-monoxide dehydrogenase medium subunit
MFPAKFAYHRAASIDEALRLLTTLPEAKLLAGGHSLLPMMKLRLAAPEALIDIGRIAELRGIEAEGGKVRIGALTTHTELCQSSVLAHHCPLLVEAASKIADPAVRNKGTIGGNVAHADPASDLPAVLIALGASLNLMGPRGKRTVAANAFFTGLLETDLDEGEILASIEMQEDPAGRGTCYLKYEHPASGYAICGAAAVVDLSAEGICTGAMLACNGLSPTPSVIKDLGDALVGKALTDDYIDAQVIKLFAIVDPIGDTFASTGYRHALGISYAQRALKLARDQAKA